MITPTMFPSWINFLKENGNKFLRRRDHEEQLPKCLKRKYKGQTLSKSNVLYTFRSSKILDIKNDHAFFI
jgi:hypothetical protein